ncbi:MAG: hypothetical protein EBS05_10165 [Proteobacteria bacterium]|nr:hypothetical protein [Pseudomonadota bacterium]NDE98291.1 hypothetical protein [Verrucomicrobiota bacterium]
MKSNELLEKIYEASGKLKEEPIPPGFRHADQWAKAWGMHRTNALRACRIGVRTGLLECRKIRRATGSRTALVSFFKPVK